MSKAYTYIYFGLILRLFNAIYNGFFGPSFGAESDAVGYIMKATAYSINPTFDEFVMGDIYAYILGLLFYLTIPSVFLGSFISCLAWFFSALILKKTFDALGVKAQRSPLLIYALLPSSIIFTSIPLRESFQLLFVNIAAYSILMISIKGYPRYWISLILSSACMGVLHGALLAFGFYLITASVMAYNYLRNRPTSVPSVLVGMLFFFIGVGLFFPVMDSISYELGEGLDESIQAYQLSAMAMDGRANYKSGVAEGHWEMLRTLPYTLFQFLFEPMPWNISAPVDFVAFVESFLKAYLVFCAFRLVSKSSTKFVRFYTFIFVSWIVISIIWSVGTVNWGTSSRHHIPGLALLLLCAYAVSGVGGKSKPA
jgi:hypothetical protein